MKLEIEVSPAGKALAVSFAAIPLAFIGVLLNSPTLIIVGVSLAVACLIALWIIRPRCLGHMKWWGTEDNEIQVATCTGCDRWVLKVREGFAAHGRGFEEFEEKIEAVASKYEGHLPYVAARLRKIATVVQKNAEPTS
jgi:hypothetical protein